MKLTFVSLFKARDCTGSQLVWDFGLCRNCWRHMQAMCRTDKVFWYLRGPTVHDRAASLNDAGETFSWLVFCAWGRFWSLSDEGWKCNSRALTDRKAIITIMIQPGATTVQRQCSEQWPALTQQPMVNVHKLQYLQGHLGPKSNLKPQDHVISQSMGTSPVLCNQNISVSWTHCQSSSPWLKTLKIYLTTLWIDLLALDNILVIYTCRCLLLKMHWIFIFQVESNYTIYVVFLLFLYIWE